MREKFMIVDYSLFTLDSKVALMNEKGELENIGKALSNVDELAKYLVNAAHEYKTWYIKVSGPTVFIEEIKSKVEENEMINYHQNKIIVKEF